MALTNAEEIRFQDLSKNNVRNSQEVEERAKLKKWRNDPKRNPAKE